MRWSIATSKSIVRAARRSAHTTMHSRPAARAVASPAPASAASSDDRAGHLRLADAAVAEDDRHLDHAEAGADGAVGGLDLERVAERRDRLEVDRLEHLAAEDLEAAGEVARSRRPSTRAGVGAAAAADQPPQRRPSPRPRRRRRSASRARGRRRPAAASSRGRSAGSWEKSASICATSSAPPSSARAEAGDVGGAEALLARRGAGPRRRRRAAASRSAISPVPSGEASSTTSSRALGRQPLERPRRRSPRGCRPRCRSAGRARPAALAGSRHRAQSRVRPMPMRNAEIAAAMAELGTLYELDGANRYRVIAYQEAARVIRQSPVSVEELALRRQGDRAARDRRHAAGEDRRPARDRRDPGGGEAEGEVPRLADRGDADPGPRREDRAQALRRARGRQPRRAARGRRGRADPRRSRASARRSRRTCSPRSAKLGEEGPRRAAAALGGAAGRRGAGRGAARAPGLATRSRSPARRAGWPRPARTST